MATMRITQGIVTDINFEVFGRIGNCLDKFTEEQL